MRLYCLGSGTFRELSRTRGGKGEEVSFQRVRNRIWGQLNRQAEGIRGGNYENYRGKIWPQLRRRVNGQYNMRPDRTECVKTFVSPQENPRASCLNGKPCKHVWGHNSKGAVKVSEKPPCKQRRAN